MIPVRRRPLCPSLRDRFSSDRHDLATSSVLHLAPGVAFTAAAFPLARWAAERDLPPALGLQAATVVVLAPMQLGVVSLAARLRTGSWRPRGALGSTARLPRRRLVMLGAATLTWAGAVFVSTGPVADAIRTSLFEWWPATLDYAGHLADPDRFSRAALITAAISGFIATTVVAPVVEEVYFRGFLLPRIRHLGTWAPLVNTALFAAYHVWSPWQIPTRIVALLPLVHATWRTRSLMLAIAVHVALNLVGDSLAGIAVVLRH